MACVKHAGGMSVFQLGRPAELNKSIATDAQQRPFADYMANFWFDLDLHRTLLRAVIEVVGVNQIVYGTDFGGACDNGDLTAGVWLSQRGRELVRSGNATRLLKLAPPGRPSDPVAPGSRVEGWGMAHQHQIVRLARSASQNHPAANPSSSN